MVQGPPTEASAGELVKQPSEQTSRLVSDSLQDVRRAAHVYPCPLIEGALAPDAPIA